MPKRAVRHAPFLRRYARALTGSQAEGDVLVQAAITHLLAGRAPLDLGGSLRVSLYRALHEVAGVPGDDSPSRAVVSLERAAMLLIGVEDFSLEEAALILDVSRDALQARLETAEALLAAQSKTEVLIIEDEPIIALDLTRLVMDLGHEVTGVATTRDSALDLARRRNPGLLLADVRLADGSSGLEAATLIREAVDIPVIFITAFPEHLLTGERPEPAFLVTKPFREDAVKALIAQALFFHAKGLETDGASGGRLSADASPGL